MKRRIAICVATLALVAMTGNPTVLLGASAVGSFFEGQTIRIVFGTGPGAGNDLHARLLARVLPRYVPGNPSVIVMNMPGAASLIATNYVYTRGKPDGLTIGVVGGGTLVVQFLRRDPAVRYDPSRFIWLGTSDHGPFPRIAWVRAALGFKTIDDLRATKKPIHFGSAGGPGSAAYMLPVLMEAALNVPIKIIEGYIGSPAVALAIDRGELDGADFSLAFAAGVRPDWIEKKTVVPLLRAGPIPQSEQQRFRALVGDIPDLLDFDMPDEIRKLIQFGISTHAVFRAFVLPPDVPEDRVVLLRTAFMKALRDPEVQQAALKAGLLIDPRPGQETEQLVKGLLGVSPELWGRYRAVVLGEKGN